MSAYTLNIIGKDGGMLDRMVSKIIKSVVPKRIKKIILISSLLAVVHNKKSWISYTETYKQINRLLVLAHNDKTIDYDVSVADVIWGNVLVDKTFTLLNGENVKYLKLPNFLKVDLEPLELRELGELIYKEIPNWLLYLSKEAMLSDIVYMLHISKSKV